MVKKVTSLDYGLVRGLNLKNIRENWELFQQFMDFLKVQFGDTCEIVLHDLTNGYEHTIVDIRNGHITGRKIGDCGSNLGLEVLRGTESGNNNCNYITYTKDNRILRSSSMFFKDEDGNVIGSLCINLDITDTVRFENYLHNYNKYEINNGENKIKEVFATNVNELFDYLIKEAQEYIGKPVVLMNKEEKVEFVKYLDKKGAFLITKSGDKICEFLNISKFTLYNYLDQQNSD